MKKEVYYILVLSVLYCALIAANENDTTTDGPTTAAMDDANNGNNTGIGSMHGSHSGYNAWYFLTTVSMVIMLLVNRMNV